MTAEQQKEYVGYVRRLAEIYYLQAQIFEVLAHAYEQRDQETIIELSHKTRLLKAEETKTHALLFVFRTYHNLTV